MKKSIYSAFFIMLMFFIAPGIADACSGTYYYCNSCGGDTPTKESILAEAAENCLAGSSYTLHDIETGKESKVWVTAE